MGNAYFIRPEFIEISHPINLKIMKNNLLKTTLALSWCFLFGIILFFLFPVQGFGNVNIPLENWENESINTLSKSLNDPAELLFFSADIAITGKVTDEKGEPIPGATVSVPGTNIGTATDIDGNYSLTVPDNSRLVFSFIGYQSQTVEVGNSDVIDIKLQESSQALDEVVVIGYGTQIQSRVTGSVGTANAEDMARISMPTVTQALQGRVAGVFIKNQSGQPGRNKTSINIRGFGSPLYIVDGLPVEEAVFANINPNDIESLSVLKDAASAAVYGARAGNGVVLVATKRGKADQVRFNYRGDVGFQGLTAIPNPISSWEHMALFNIRRIDRGQPTAWSPDIVADYRQFGDGSDPENFANVNMYDLVTRNASPMLTHDLSLNGGSDRVRYFISANLFDQTGLENNVFGETETRFKRYNIRGNVDVDVTEKFKFNFDMSYNLQDFIGPRNEFEGTAWNQGQGIFARSHRWRPFHPIEELPGGHRDFPRGAVGGVTVNPLNLASTHIGGSNEFTRGFVDLKLGGQYQLLPGLSTRVVVNYQGTNLQTKRFQKQGPEYQYNPDTEEHFRVRALNIDTRVERISAFTQNLNFQYFLNGDHSWGKHSLTSMYVFEFIRRDFESISASRIQYDFPIAQLSAGPPSQQFSNDAIALDKRMGHIGRISYNYDDKYSLEVSARYDGSMKFPADSRWGFFPSASGAWNIDRESFMQGIVSSSFLTALKLRGSYGRLGFDGAGNFQFLPTYSFRNNFIFGGDNLLRTTRNDGFPNPFITWEKMDIINLGLEASFWDGILEGSFDIYQRNRFDVLGRRTLETPPVVGAVLPLVNFQEYENRGVELTLTHNNRIKDIDYSISANIGVNEEIIRNIDEPDFVNKEFERRQSAIGYRTRTGNRGGAQLFYFQTDGLFTSQDEIDNWAIIDGNGNRSIMVGDARVIDLNGDGRITDADRNIATSGTNPRMQFGFNTRIEWKGLEIVTFWQGASLFAYNIRWGEMGQPFPSDGVALQHHLTEAYIPANEYGLPTVSAEQAIYPRAAGSQNPNYDLFLIDGTYLRLKQLQIGYSLPQDIVSKLRMQRMKLYAGGTNLLTFSALDWLDPEIDEQPAQFFGNYHPQTRVFNFGVEIGF